MPYPLPLDYGEYIYHSQVHSLAKLHTTHIVDLSDLLQLEADIKPISHSALYILTIYFLNGPLVSEKIILAQGLGSCGSALASIFNCYPDDHGSEVFGSALHQRAV